MLNYSGTYRKSKPIGLPYKGSKKKISRQIVQIIKENFGEDKVVYDLFGGGGAITLECHLQGLNVVYNELQERVFRMFKKSLELTTDEIKSLLVSREEFNEIKNKESRTDIENLTLLVNSFGNLERCYLYSEEKSDIKYSLAKKIIENEGTWTNYKTSKTYKEKIEQLKKVDQLEQMQQIEQLTRLQQLTNLKQVNRLADLKVNKLELYNKDYKEFSHVENAILYLDPPYENVSGYSDNRNIKTPPKEKLREIRDLLYTKPKNRTIEEDGILYHIGGNNRLYFKKNYNNFSSREFYDWVYNMSKKNIVIISSYEIIDERFKCVYTFDRACSTLAGGTNKTKKEKLFMVVN